MKMIFCWFAILSLGAEIWAQTNPVASTSSTPQQEIGLHAGHAHYDGNARQLVYYDHVVVTNAQGRLTCERLTINLPPESAADSHPTNAVAEINLDIIFVDNRGKTNHLTCDKGIYDYSVVNTITNETFTFTGHATNTMAEGWFSGEPLIWDNIKKTFDLNSQVDVHLKMRPASDKGTNNSPLNLLK